RPVDTADSVLGDLIDHFAGGSRDQRPAIDRVVVKGDWPPRLSVAVSYNGLANARLTGEVRGRDRNSPPQIQAPPVLLGGAAGEATLVFDLPSSDGGIPAAYLGGIATEPR